MNSRIMTPISVNSGLAAARGVPIQERRQKRKSRTRQKDADADDVAVDAENRAGRYFKLCETKVKYHSGRMPAGAEANGSAFTPSSQGRERAQHQQDTRAHRATGWRRAG